LDEVLLSRDTKSNDEEKAIEKRVLMSSALKPNFSEALEQATGWLFEEFGCSSLASFREHNNRLATRSAL
jgi:hypothetical protein